MELKPREWYRTRNGLRAYIGMIFGPHGLAFPAEGYTLNEKTGERKKQNWQLNGMFGYGSDHALDITHKENEMEQAQKIDLTSKYKTRDGRVVSELHANPHPDSQRVYPIRGRIAGNDTYDVWSDTGRYTVTNGENRADLVPAEEAPAPARHKIDFCRPVKTNDGRDVVIISREGRGDYPIIGYFGDSKTPQQWNVYGDALNATERVYLTNRPKQVEVWVNVYSNGEVHHHASRERADAKASERRIARKKVVIIEGQFDE